jgi:hypothetical protein
MIIFNNIYLKSRACDIFPTQKIKQVEQPEDAYDSQGQLKQQAHG